MVGTMLQRFVETTTNMEVMFTRMGNTRDKHLLETMGIIYLIWNLLFNLEGLHRINHRMLFYALDDGHATIAMLQPL